jgi:hypothetical protein
LGRNAQKTPLLADTLQLGDITVGVNLTENTVLSGVSIILL